MDINNVWKVMVLAFLAILALLVFILYRIWELRKACDVLAKGIGRILGVNNE